MDNNFPFENYIKNNFLILESNKTQENFDFLKKYYYFCLYFMKFLRKYIIFIIFKILKFLKFKKKLLK